MAEEEKLKAEQRIAARIRQQIEITEASTRIPTLPLQEQRTTPPQIPTTNAIGSAFPNHGSLIGVNNVSLSSLPTAIRTSADIHNVGSPMGSDRNDSGEEEDDDDDLNTMGMEWEAQAQTAPTTQTIEVRHENGAGKLQHGIKERTVIGSGKNEATNHENIDAFMASRSAAQRHPASHQHRANNARSGQKAGLGQIRDKMQYGEHIETTATFLQAKALDCSQIDQKQDSDPVPSSANTSALRSIKRTADSQVHQQYDIQRTKRPRSAVTDHIYGRRPTTRSSAQDSLLLTRPARLSQPVKSKSKLIPTRKTSPSGTPKLPRLNQGKSKFSNYYKVANNAFPLYRDHSTKGQQHFVNHFIKGIHKQRDRDVAIKKLQALQESSVLANGTPWIICDWVDVLEALVAGKLLTQEEVA